MQSLAVDIGGTFTDLALEHDGRRYHHQGPDHAGRARAGRDGRRARRSWPPPALAAADIGIVIHGTTLATNAVIERKGARTALLTTEGFRDVIAMGNESRYDQYDLNIDAAASRWCRAIWRLPVPERLDNDGQRAAAAGRGRGATRLSPSLRRERVESIADRLPARLRQSGA